MTLRFENRLRISTFTKWLRDDKIKRRWYTKHTGWDNMSNVLYIMKYSHQEFDIHSEDFREFKFDVELLDIEKEFHIPTEFYQYAVGDFEEWHEDEHKLHRMPCILVEHQGEYTVGVDLWGNPPQAFEPAVYNLCLGRDFIYRPFNSEEFKAKPFENIKEKLLEDLNKIFIKPRIIEYPEV